jgi:glycosyltransferase involved in cell wall biosynthesis
MNRVRIAVVNSHPIQYFAPLYAYLNASEDIEVTALYCSDFSLRGGNDPGFNRPVTWDIDLMAGYRPVFLGERSKVRVPGGFFSLIAPEIWREVRSGKYDVLLLHGHAHAANLIALLAAKTKGIPVMMRGDTHLALRRGLVKRLLRRLLIGGLYYFCDRFLAIGSANRAFYLAMGVPAEKIFLAPYSVDNARFIRQSQMNQSQCAAVRRELGLPLNKPVVLYASKLIARKHPDDVVRAIALLKKQGLDCAVFIVGTGEMEDQLRSLASNLGLDDVIFAGFVNQGDLPRIYAVSDVFVLPSDNEPWGLIVNEAMCAGMPVVVADEVGCVADLVADGENGFCHRAGDVRGLAASLERILADDGLRQRMGQESLRRISHWSYAECLEGIRNAVRGIPRAASQ